MTELIEGIEQRLQSVREQLRRADPEGRVELLAVSKTFPVEAVLIAALEGQRAFGENYAQEGCGKIDWVRENRPDLALTWHFIGPLQSNKTRIVAEHFDWVQTVCREKIAQRLNDQRPQDMPPLNVLVEVNIDGEESKSGVRPEEVPALCSFIQGLPRLRLRGLMAIPAPAGSDEERMKPLAAMRALFESVKDEFGLDTLSMGMSADMLQAVRAGSTMVRVGSAIFGHRDYGAKG